MTAVGRDGLRARAPDLARTVAEFVGRARGDAEALVLRGEGGVPVARRLASTYDGLLSSLWLAAEAVVRGAGLHGRACLVALGGYGRGRLALHSDLDLLVLPGSAAEGSDDAFAAAVAEAILYPLWDAGLDVGHAVRTAEESAALAEHDLKTATTLLDGRRVAGDAALAQGLADEAQRVVAGPGLASFLDRLRTDATSRHARYGGELHLLEPDVRNGRGGLRDLDVALWAARARAGSGALGLGDLPTLGLLAEHEWTQVAAADDFLWRVRNLLHARGGRRSERLTFEDQAEVARSMGFGDDEADAVPRFMQTYYRHAEAIAGRMDAVLERSLPRRPRERTRARPLGAGLVLRDGAIAVTDAGAFRADPANLVRLFYAAAGLGAPLDPNARDLAAREALVPAVGAALRRSPEAARLLLALLAAPTARPGVSALMELHATGLLVALLPEFARLEALVQHDVYHVYTVDVHSIRAVARLHEVLRGEWSAMLPLATRVAEEVRTPVQSGLLALAVLLHDVGKGRGADHSRLGAELAAEAAVRLGLSDADRDTLVFLVLEHLLLYRAAMQRDTEDPTLLAEVERRVGTPERLGLLYLLTLADLGTTGPTVLTDWKVAMLDELYRKLGEVFEGRTARPRVDAVRAEVLAAWPGGADADAHAQVAALPDEYLSRHGAEGVVRHLAFVNQRRSAGGADAPRVGAWSARRDDGTAELLVRAPDRPGLLARIACALTANRLQVVTADIHVGADGFALDVFHVRGADGAARLAAAARRVESDLVDLLGERVTADALLAARRPPSALRERRLPLVQTKVVVDNRVSADCTVVDVYTRDRPGVLHLIARTLGELDLTVARSRVTTEGHRVADSFYVARVGGGKLLDPDQIEALRARLTATLEGVPSRRYRDHQ